MLFVIRTADRPWKNRPSAPLVVTTLAVVAIGALLPLSPLAAPLGLARLPAAYYGFLVLGVGSYLVVVELVKPRLMRRLLGTKGCGGFRAMHAAISRSGGPTAARGDGTGLASFP